MPPPPIRCLAIILPLLVGAVACSATGKINCEGNFLYDSTSFTPEQQGWIEEASDRWNKWVGRKVTSAHPGYAGGCTIDVGKTKKESAVGEAESRLQNITIDMEDLNLKHPVSREVFEGVVMHEMGHALGYGHIGEDGKALMAPAGSVDFTELDRIECIKHGMCSTLLTSDQTDQLNKKENENETQSDYCN